MLMSTVNLFSLLIPSFMFGLSCIIFILHFVQKIPNYFYWYAFSSALTAISLFLFALIPLHLLTQISFIFIIFLLIAYALCVHAVYIRLKLKTHWGFIAGVIAIAIPMLYYFSIINEQYSVRLFVSTSASILISSNNLNLFKTKFTQRLDRWLKSTIYAIICFSILRSIFIYAVLGATNQTFLTNNLLLAVTQLMIFCAMIGIAILLYGATYQDILYRLQHERSTDPLTGLLNRRAIYEHLNGLKSHGIKQHAIILCDIDHFKKVNDFYGHLIGDLALKHVTSLLVKNVRQNDQVGRLGGEEFLIMLQNTSKDTAVIIAERLRDLIENTPLSYQNIHIPLTVSFGVSTFYTHQNFDQALQTTDLLLYQAKKFGRNKVEWQIQN